MRFWGMEALESPPESEIDPSPGSLGKDHVRAGGVGIGPQRTQNPGIFTTCS